MSVHDTSSVLVVDVYLLQSLFPHFLRTGNIFCNESEYLFIDRICVGQFIRKASLSGVKDQNVVDNQQTPSNISRSEESNENLYMRLS